MDPCLTRILLRFKGGSAGYLLVEVELERARRSKLVPFSEELE